MYNTYGGVMAAGKKKKLLIVGVLAVAVVVIAIIVYFFMKPPDCPTGKTRDPTSKLCVTTASNPAASNPAASNPAASNPVIEEVSSDMVSRVAESYNSRIRAMGGVNSMSHEKIRDMLDALYIYDTDGPTKDNTARYVAAQGKVSDMFERNMFGGGGSCPLGHAKDDENSQCFSRYRSKTIVDKEITAPLPIDISRGVSIRTLQDFPEGQLTQAKAICLMDSKCQGTLDYASSSKRIFNISGVDPNKIKVSDGSGMYFFYKKF
jgi:hypothetical protein